MTDLDLFFLLIPGHLVSVADLPQQHCTGQRHQVCDFSYIVILGLMLQPDVGMQMRIEFNFPERSGCLFRQLPVTFNHCCCSDRLRCMYYSDCIAVH